MRIFKAVLRAVGAALSLIFTALMVLPMLVRIVNLGNIAGALLGVWAFVMCVTPLRRRLRKITYKFAVTKFLYRLVNVLMCAFLIYGTVATALIFGFSAVKPAESSTVIVLGAQVRANGQPSVILAERIRAAEEYLRENPDSKAVLSGGQGEDEGMAEARCMYEIMTVDGISPDRLFIEDKAESTAENFAFSKRIMEENGLNENIAIATDRFHQIRARIIADKQGFDGQKGAVNAETRWDLIAVYTAREWFAIVKDGIF